MRIGRLVLLWVARIRELSERKVIPLPLGGQWSGGDPGLVPDGYVRTMTNMLYVDGVWVKRPPAIAEAASVSTGFVGFANWEDTTNRIIRLIAFYTNGANTDFRVKATSGETYGSAVTGTNVTGTPVTFTNYRGVMFYTMASASNPLGLFSYNGSTVTANPLGGETLYSLTVAAFIDRLFLGYVRASVVNQLGTTTAYDSTSWTATNVTAANITNTTVTSRIIPTDDETAEIRKADVYAIAPSTTDTSLVFRADLRNTSPVDEMPMTLEIYYSQVWLASTLHNVGAIRVPTTLNGFRYRATNTETSGATEPGWPVTKGATVVDGGITWICDGDEELASQPITLPTATAQQNFLPWWCKATAPPSPGASSVGVRIKFGTVATPTFKLNAIDISVKDGAADGVLTKRNYGQQLTVGKFFYPFFNQESSATATIDLHNDIYWTETSDPNTIVGDNFFRLSEAPGKVTAMAVAGGRLIVFKKRGMWVFQGTDDPENPIIRERFFGNVGCFGPRAWTVFEDTLYFIGENEIYSFRGGEPEPLCGDGMRKEVLDSIAATLADYPLGLSLAVEPARRYLYIPGTGVNAGEAGGFAYHIDRKWFSQIDIEPTAEQYISLQHWIYNPNTGNIYGHAVPTSGTNGPFVMNNAQSAADSAPDAAAGQIGAVTFKKIDSGVDRREMILQEIGAWLGTSSAITTTVTLIGSQSKTNAVTGGGGATFPRIKVPLRQAGPHFVIKIAHSGNCGAESFSISRAEAVLKEMGPERDRFPPTQGSASL